jgi:lipoate-protein ligase A
MTLPLRVLTDSPLDGPTNMARDEALLESCVAGATPPTLRFYRWSVPTISLGYFQPFSDYEALHGPARGLAVVRRTTGGGAILHDLELTYALAVARHHPLLESGPTALYLRMHDAIIAVLQNLGVRAVRREERPFAPPARPSGTGGTGRGPDGDGPQNAPHGARTDSQDPDEPFFCFARRHPLDIVVGDRKLAGSAQRRLAGGVLQHGSIILDSIHTQQPSIGVGEFCRVEPDSLARRIAERFAADNGLACQPGAWQPLELQQAGRLTDRYNDVAWTRRC